MGKIIDRARARQSIKQKREERKMADEAFDHILRAYAAIYAPPPGWLIALFGIAFVVVVGYMTYVVCSVG